MWNREGGHTWNRPTDVLLLSVFSFSYRSSRQRDWRSYKRDRMDKQNQKMKIAAKTNERNGNVDKWTDKPTQLTNYCSRQPVHLRNFLGLSKAA